jgi:Family of unknown function (DUF6325)
MECEELLNTDITISYSTERLASWQAWAYNSRWVKVSVWVATHIKSKGVKNMTIGPLEFAVIGCKGHQFTSEIVPELNSIQEKGLIRVVDLFFVRKDANGTVTVLEVHDLNDEELAAFDPIKEDLMGLLTPEDIALLTKAIPPDTSAVIVLLEHAWIVKLTEGLNRAGAVLLAGGMVPQASMEQLEAELKVAQQQSQES